MLARVLGSWLRASKIAEVEAARPSEGLGPGLSEHHFHYILSFQASAVLVQMQEHENGRHGSLAHTTMLIFQGICVFSACHAM